MTCMTDGDTSNRHWPTFLLANQVIDTPEVRRSLLMAAQDEDATVRADDLRVWHYVTHASALPLVVQKLACERCGYGAFEAANQIGAPLLLSSLLKWRGRGGAPWINEAIEAAIRACGGEI